MIGFQGELIAFLATALIIYFTIPKAARIGLIDRSSSQKLHQSKIPMVGGIAIFCGFMIAIFSSNLSENALPGFIFPALLLIAVGIADDLISLSSKTRLVTQIMAGIFLTVWGGIVLQDLGALIVYDSNLTLGIFSIPFTIICLVGLVNAYNMADGTDGLSGSLGLVAIVGVAVLSYMAGRQKAVYVLLTFASSLIAFLGFNMRLPWRSRAVVFLGNSGSMLLGFVVTWFMVNLSQGQQAVMTPVTALWLVALPFYDMAAIILRRISKGQSPFLGDREHLHHVLLMAGFSVVQTVLILIGLASGLAIIGIAGFHWGVPQDLMFTAFLALFALYFYAYMRAWKLRRLLSRTICRRRDDNDRRSGKERRRHPARVDQRRFEGANRRSSGRRRALQDRRQTSRDEQAAAKGGRRHHVIRERWVQPKKQRIIFLNRFFYPDISATSQLVSTLAFELSAKGGEVHVITSRRRYDVPEADFPLEEKVGGVQVHRVWSSAFGHHGLFARGIDYATFYASAIWRLWGLTTSGDMIVAETDPPLICVPAAWIASIRQAILINWQQDIFPEVAAQAGLRVFQGGIAHLLIKLRNAALCSASMNIVLSRRMAQHLKQQGTDAERIRIIPNWSNGDIIRPIDRQLNSLRQSWDLDQHFVIGYSGNMGRVHEFDTVMRAAERLKGHPQYLFLFIGSGYRRPRLEAFVKEKKLNNVRFKPYQPCDRLCESLGVPDVHLISLCFNMEGLVFPSKLYGVLAAGRPLIFIGAPDGDLAYILKSEGCGLCVQQGDVEGLIHAIDQFYQMPTLRQSMGIRARGLFEKRYDESLAMQNWCQVISRLKLNDLACDESEEARDKGQEVREEVREVG
jgi:colanic acid biosynthesis glycosyl transferase WcaI